MATRVGINGFGRIGRSVFRILSERDDINVVCINDLFENEQLAYLLKYDTVMGIFKKEVTATDDALYVGDQKVVMTEHRDPAAIPWKDLGIDVVIESTGVFRERAPLENLVKDNQLYSYQHRDFWKCMDTMRDKMQLNRMWKESQAEWKVWK